MRQADVLVLGGGVVGLTAAYFLARDGLRVRLLDRSQPGLEASWAGAGIIPPGNFERAGSPYDRLRALSSELFPSLTAELRETTGIDNGYRICGGIEIFPHDPSDVLSLWDQEGIFYERFDPKDREACRRIATTPIHLPEGRAYSLPGIAQVRNPWHLRALSAGCQQLGVMIEADHEIVRFQRNGQHILAAVDSRGTAHSADRYLVATGAWTGQLCEALGLSLPIHPVRGQIVLYRPESPLLNSILLLGKEYLVPRQDGRILVGSTEEPEAGFEKKVTAAGVEGLKKFATRLVPELSHIPIEKTWAGLRPGTVDGLPYLGPVPGFENLFVASGHFRAGVQLSTGTAHVLNDLLSGKSPRVPLHEFRVDRSPSSSTAIAFRS